VEGISKSQVSRICAELDEVVASWRTRPLDAGPYPFMWIDALVLKVREGGRGSPTGAGRSVPCPGTTPVKGPTRGDHDTPRPGSSNAHGSRVAVA
jgi:hypothetical protein